MSVSYTPGYYVLGNQKIPKIESYGHHAQRAEPFRKLPNLLSELVIALKDLDKNKFNFDPVDYKNKRNDILNRAEEYYLTIL